MSLYTKKQCPKDAYMNRCYQIFNKRGFIELHAPTNSTQKLKLMGRGGQFTYTSTAIKSTLVHVKGILRCETENLGFP